MLEFLAGETVKTVTFRIGSETPALDELDEHFALELFNPFGADLGGAATSLRGVGWALDDDGPGNNRAIAVSAPTVAERTGAEAEFRIVLSRAFGVETTLDFETFDGSGLAGEDYVARTGSIVFAADQTEAVVIVDLIEDLVPEATKTFGLRVSGSGSTQGSAGVATLLDPDDDLPVLSAEGARAPEDELVTFVVRLSEPAADAVTVEYRAATGTALLDTDFGGSPSTGAAPETGTIVFAVGETSKTVTFKTFADTLDELDETLVLELANPVGATFGGSNAGLRASSWALDLDGPGANRAISVSGAVLREAGAATAEFTISLSSAFTTETTLDFETFDGSALAGSDYDATSGEVTFAAGQLEAKVLVDLINDGRDEATETFGLQVSGSGTTLGSGGTTTILDTDADAPVLSITGNRALEGELLVFTVTLSEAASDSVTVDYRTLSGTAILDTDFSGSPSTGANPEIGTIEFAAGVTSRTVTLKTFGDVPDEIDETFFVELVNPVGASFGGANRTLRGTGWALDDDGVGTNRAVAVSSTTIVEHIDDETSVAVFDVQLSQAHSQRLEFDYRTVNGTARAGEDFRGRSGTVVFEADQTSATVRVEVFYDTVEEGNETFSLRLDTPFPSAISGSLAAAFGTATINDGSILGTGRNDRLRGTGEGDAILGRGGDDRIDGLGGGDALSGDTGDDRLYGGGAGDRLFGGADDDLLDGGGGADRMAGGRGDDTYVIDNEGDRVSDREGEGRDAVQSSIDHTLADEVESLLLTGRRSIDGVGNGLNNTLRGNDGRNTLNGGGGDDRIFGGDGNDTLIGGVGADEATGGDGSDTFLFRSDRDLGTGRRRDAVTDFERRRDTLDLGGIDANVDRSRDQDFRFIRDERFSDRAGELRLDDEILSGDTDGDGLADFQIALEDVSRLGASDLVL